MMMMMTLMYCMDTTEPSGRSRISGRGGGGDVAEGHEGRRAWEGNLALEIAYFSVF